VFLIMNTEWFGGSLVGHSSLMVEL
jgi:hypothetical protein